MSYGRVIRHKPDLSTFYGKGWIEEFSPICFWEIRLVLAPFYCHLGLCVFVLRIRISPCNRLAETFLWHLVSDYETDSLPETSALRCWKPDNLPWLVSLLWLVMAVAGSEIVMKNFTNLHGDHYIQAAVMHTYLGDQCSIWTCRTGDSSGSIRRTFRSCAREYRFRTCNSCPGRSSRPFAWLPLYSGWGVRRSSTP